MFVSFGNASGPIEAFNINLLQAKGSLFARGRRSTPTPPSARTLLATRQRPVRRRRQRQGEDPGQPELRAQGCAEGARDLERARPPARRSSCRERVRSTCAGRRSRPDHGATERIAGQQPARRGRVRETALLGIGRAASQARARRPSRSGAKPRSVSTVSESATVLPALSLTTTRRWSLRCASTSSAVSVWLMRAEIAAGDQQHRNVERRHPVEHRVLVVERHHDAADALDQHVGAGLRCAAAELDQRVESRCCRPSRARGDVGRQRRGEAPGRDARRSRRRDGSAERRRAGGRDRCRPTSADRSR